MPRKISPIFEQPSSRAGLHQRRIVELTAGDRLSLRRRVELAEQALENTALERLRRDINPTRARRLPRDD